MNDSAEIIEPTVSLEQTSRLIDNLFQEFAEGGLRWELLDDAESISRWIKAAALEYGNPFRTTAQGTVIGPPSSSTWYSPLLSHWPHAPNGVSHLALAFLVMEKHFINGTKVFKQLVKVSDEFDNDNSVFKPLLHHANAEDLLSGLSTYNRRDGGVYFHLAPLPGTELPLAIDDMNDIVYSGDENASLAASMKRRLVNCGFTVAFRKRERMYDDGGTNHYHSSARNTMVDGVQVDTISAWTRQLALGIPASSPKGRPVTPLFYRIYETILNLAVGATRSASRPWGLQTTCIDRSSYETKLDTIGHQEVIDQYFSLAVDPATRIYHGGWQEVKAAEHPIWKQLESTVNAEIARYHDSMWKGIEDKPDIPTYTRGGISAVITGRKGTRGEVRILQYNLPDIPLSHWGGMKDVPDMWVKVVTRRQPSEESSSSADLESVREEERDWQRNRKRKDTSKRAQAYLDRKSETPEEAAEKDEKRGVAFKRARNSTRYSI